ncbi:MAG: hypothetical protein IJI27_07420, partial [Oscillospiraceae bacterium]|nr:hypothetical protein [Oscillospiraceae bacterium]
DGNGNYYIDVPKGGGNMLSAALSHVSAEEPAPIIVPIQKPAAEPAPEKTEIAEENLDSADASVTVEPEAPAAGGEGQAEEEAAAAPVSAVVKFYDDKSFELVITTFSAEEPEKVDSVERVEGSFLLVDGVLTLKLADGREIQIDEDGVFVISLPDGRSVRIKLDPATIGKLLLNA